MKNIYLLPILIFISFSVLAQTPSFQYAFNNSAGTATNEVRNMVKDELGNIYFCGALNGDLDFNGTKLSATKGGAYFGKATKTGTIVWLKNGGTASPYFAAANDITLDKNGNVYVCGSIPANQIASFENNSLSASSGGFVAKYSNTGNFIWAKGYFLPIYGIAVDGNNTPVIHYESEIIKINSSNGELINTIWGTISGNNINAKYHNIIIDSGNNIIVQAGNKVVKYDTNFNVIWSTPVISSLAETYRISLDNQGNVYGSFYALFGTVTVGTIAKSVFPNGYMYKLYANTGIPVFVDAIQFGGNASKIKHIIVDSSENYYLGGDGAFNTAQVVKLDKTKKSIWTKTLAGNVKVNAMVLQSTDCISLVGTHSGTSAFDTFSLKLPAGATTIDNSFFASLCSGTTGTEEIARHATNIKIFPNPSNGVFTLDMDLDDAEIEIYNLQGMKVYQSRNNARQSKIDLSDQPRGIYIYRVGSERQTKTTGKLMIE
ncbi:MAG: T9SS type A sorting domain-containing protein [Prolixibacteraceae bacterium]|nr:T9SS type A sorting domain-containing protein [Prolixibacteraceae bacterium]